MSTADPSASPAHANHKLTLAYDGRRFFGWQRHGKNATVQGALEDALREIFGVACPVIGAGRTDRGAHAEGQVASFRHPKALADGQDAHTEALSTALAKALPPELEVRGLEEVAMGFHARDDATGKRYRYEIFQGGQCPEELEGQVWLVKTPLDVVAMRRAAPALLGSHDFASFATRSNFERKSTVRQLRTLDIEGDASPRLRLILEADSFLYKMVRNIVRALVKVGEGRWKPAKLAQVLAAKDRQAAPGTAPASGLYLDRVDYGEGSTP